MKVNLSTSIEVDSLKLRIPLTHVEDCKVQDILNPHIEVSELTGEVKNVKNKGHRIRVSDSAVIHVDIKKVKTTSNKPPIECLIILLNSKILETRYFEGITQYNLQIVYNKLIESGLFKFSWDTFIKARCTDVDLKFDEIMDRATRIDLIKSFNQVVLPKRTDSVRTYIPRNETSNEVGIQFNYRERATTSKPFFKIYSKGAESMTKDAKSTDAGEVPFFDSYFDTNDLQDICRIETTIKGIEMAKAIGIKSMQLGDIMHWTEETKIQIFRYMFSKYLSTHALTNNAEPKNDKLTPSDVALFNSLVIIIEHTDMPVEVVINELTKNIDARNSKGRMKKKLMEIYKEHIENTKYDNSESAKKIGRFLSKFGLA